MREPRPLTVSDDIRDLLIKLRKLSNATGSPSIAIDQIQGLEEALKCIFPDPIIAAFANGDDALCEQHGVRIEEVYNNTLQARETGHPKDMIAIGRHPDDHCFYCISKSPPSKSNPGISEYDNFDGSSKFFTLRQWLSQIVEHEVDFNETDPVVSDEDRVSFIPSLV